MSQLPFSISMPVQAVRAEIFLPGSKSECNRALVIRALSGGTIEVSSISAAEDTRILLRLIELASRRQQGDLVANIDKTWSDNFPEALVLDAGAAGTVMRFMTAFLSVQPGAFILTGSERMKERPVKILVTALKQLGAEITYLEKDGFPPIYLGPVKSTGTEVAIAGDISSQYISALLLIAPVLENGLKLKILGELTSRPYVNMTLQMMKLAGINYSETADSITIPAQSYGMASLAVEPDWSASSYWFSIAALLAEAEIFLPGLRKDSLQGDRVIAGLMKQFGVASVFEEDGLRLTKGVVNFQAEVMDLKECPDLAQTLIVCAAALGQNLSFTGLETLRIKETDRIAALQAELAKIGVKLLENGAVYTLDTSGLFFPEEITVATYHDHRMAMAFAPLALRIGKVSFDNKEVIIKSYPAFWDHLESSGFQLNS